MKPVRDQQEVNSTEPQSISEREAHLTSKERVLLWLLKHPFQRIEDLAFALKLHVSSVCRHLVALEQQGMIEQVRPPQVGTKPQATYYLTTTGLHAIANILGADPAKLAQMWRVGEGHLLRLIPRLSTFMLLHDLVSGIVAYAPTRLMHPGGYPATIRWHWVHDYMHSFVWKGTRERCRADAVLAMTRALPGTGTQKAETLFTALWMVDAGLLGGGNQRLIQQRLEALLKFRESTERWRSYSHFPPLLVVTRSARNHLLWQQCALEASTRKRVAPLAGAIVTLEPGIPKQSGFPWTLPWQHLTTSRPCRLEDLLIPIPIDSALPNVLAPRMIPEGTFQHNQDDTEQTDIIKGRFSARSHQRTESEQEALSLLGLQLGYRHLECLLQLYQHPLLSREEVATFGHLQPETATRYLYDLRAQACVEIYHTSRGKRYALSERGGRFIAMYLHISQRHMFEKEASGVRVQRGVPSLLQKIKHTAGIYHFLARVQEEARQEGHLLEWWEAEARSARRYRSQKHWHNFLPDATFAYRAEEKRFSAWLEWDEGTMHTSDLTAKFAAYAHFLETREWMKDHMTLPILLMVTPHPGQEQRVSRIAQRTLAHTSLVVIVTTQTRLGEHGPLGPIWLPVLPHTFEDQRRKLLDPS
ncbi:replication-relaxation family protein [Ktedonobacter robiniae]|uniref:HTH marR-type domain-containing protein n=1 Tax=Ktedonobacter robiniae TaxID=2778365 RepID=A0ABQ3V3J1_9CHLR|nr:replication-relaxation family protein [Ktedonobacter robiniae]GHO59210.1 hypothetical protein KSB_76850 [Ktedonobacter robiniae]